jgi:hypothetical protein
MMVTVSNRLVSLVVPVAPWQHRGVPSAAAACVTRVRSRLQFAPHPHALRFGRDTYLFVCRTIRNTKGVNERRERGEA